MPWFVTLIVMSQLAWITVACSILGVLIDKFGTRATQWLQWAALSAVAYSSLVFVLLCCSSAMPRWVSMMRASALKQRVGTGGTSAATARVVSGEGDLSHLPVAVAREIG